MNILEQKIVNDKSILNLEKELSNLKSSTDKSNKLFINKVVSYIKSNSKKVGIDKLHLYVKPDEMDRIVIYSSGSDSPADHVSEKIIRESVVDSIINKKNCSKRGMYNEHDFLLFRDKGNIALYHRGIIFGDSDDRRKMSVKVAGDKIEILYVYGMFSNSIFKIVQRDCYTIKLDKEQFESYLETSDEVWKIPNAPVPFPYM